MSAKIREFFERIIPFVQWREESERLSFQADLAEEWPNDNEKAAESDNTDDAQSSRTSSRTSAGVKNADGSAKK